jgi:branched-subunit amino acid ABC-type transport system permease component
MGVIQSVIFGLQLGSYIAIAAVGFTLIYGVVNFINFAYGEYMTIGAFMTFITVNQWGLPAIVGLLIALVVTAGLGWIVSRIVFVPMQGTGAIPMLMASIGLGMFLRNFYQLIAGGEVRFVDVGASQFEFGFLGGFFVSTQHILIISSAFIIFALIHVLLTRTQAGIAMRATSHNELLARASGIRTKQVRRNVWIVASALAGVSGFLIGTTTFVSPLTGFNQILLVLAAAILGGAGSAYGAFFGSYILAFVITFTTAYLPTEVSGLGETLAFAVLIVVLLVRPSGLADVEVEA